MSKKFNHSSFMVAAMLKADDLQDIYRQVGNMGTYYRFVNSTFFDKNKEPIMKYVNAACNAVDADACIDAYNHLIDVCIGIGTAEFGDAYRKVVNTIENGEAVTDKGEFDEVLTKIKPVLIELWACVCELYALKKKGMNPLSMIQNAVHEAQKKILGNPKPAEQPKVEPVQQTEHPKKVDQKPAEQPKDIPVSSCEFYMICNFYNDKRMNAMIKRARKAAAAGNGGFEKSNWAANPISKSFIDDITDRAHAAATIKELIGIYDEAFELFVGFSFMLNADRLKKAFEDAEKVETEDQYNKFCADYKAEIDQLADAIEAFFTAIMGEHNMSKFGITPEVFIRSSIKAGRKNMPNIEPQPKNPQPSSPAGAVVEPVQQQSQPIAAEAIGEHRPNFSKFVVSQQPQEQVQVNPTAIGQQQAQPVHVNHVHQNNPQPVQSGPVVLGNGAAPMPSEIKRSSWNAKSLAPVSWDARMQALNEHFKLLKGNHPGFDDITMNTLLSTVTSTVVYNVCAKAGVEIPATGLTFVEIPMATYGNLASADLSNYNIALRTEQTGKDGDPVVVYLNDRALSPMTMEAFTPSFQKKIKAKSSNKKSSKSKASNNQQSQPVQKQAVTC